VRARKRVYHVKTNTHKHEHETTERILKHTDNVIFGKRGGHTDAQGTQPEPEPVKSLGIEVHWLELNFTPVVDA